MYALYLSQTRALGKYNSLPYARGCLTNRFIKQLIARILSNDFFQSLH